MRADHQLAGVVGRRVMLAAMAVTVAATLVGCGHGAAAGASPGEQILKSLSEREVAALVDKKISFGEYESAARSEDDCVKALGVKTDPVVPGKDGTFSLSWETSATGEEFERLEAGTLTCHADIDAIAAVYVLQHAATEDDLKVAEASFRTCAGTIGVPGASDETVGRLVVTMQEMVQAERLEIEPALACVDIVETVSAQPLPGLDDAFRLLEF